MKIDKLTKKTVAKIIINKSAVVIIMTFLLGISACDIEEDTNNSETKDEYSGSQVTASLAQSTRSLDPNFMCFNVNTLLVESWRNPEFGNAVNQLNPRMLRFPGGTVADYWDWQRGGLIQDFSGIRKVPGIYKNRRVSQYTEGKLEDFKTGLEATGTTPLFVLNVLTSTLEEQLEMLRSARDLGIPVKYIQIGNESYFALADNIAAFPTPEDYGRTAERWNLEIKKEFPEATIGAIAVNPNFATNMRRKKRIENWNDDVLRTAGQVDAISFNIYQRSGLDDDGDYTGNQYPFFALEDMSSILGMPFVEWQNIQNDQTYQSISNNKQIWITEYNLSEGSSGSQRPNPRIAGSWVHGLYVMLMSLLFLEDQRISTICNHALIGNSKFGAIFADEGVIGRRIFINPSEEVSATPFSLSATGSALRLLGDATEDMTQASKINFSDSPTLTGSDGFEYDALYGWVFTNGREMRAVIMNLSNQNLNVGLSDDKFSQTVQYEQVSGDPRTLVTGPGILTENSGTVSGQITLPAYSVTKLSTEK